MEGFAKPKVYRNDLLYPDLSYKINGVLFDVFKQLGGGHPERYYQLAVKEGLRKAGLRFEEQKYVPLKYGDKLVGKYYLDFLVENVVVLELKRGRYVPVNVINQVKQYLTALSLELAIIACFAYDCVVPKRIVNENKM